jgi:outer membrane beta-barrel protein
MTMKVFRTVLLTALVLTSYSQAASAADKKSKAAAEPPASPVSATAAPNAEEGEQVDVSKITEKYWAQGKETELGVVQNRKFTSANRFELELMTGTLSTDPFLSVRNYGLSLGYHLNQYVSFHGIYWRSVAAPSDALKTFESQVPGSTVNTNMPKQFYGAQVNYNLLYGKASLFGNLIIYVDVFAMGGAGFSNTETGTYFTPFVGIGQKIHLNKFMALTIDYRLMRFNEQIRQKARNSNVLGNVVGERSNTSDAVTLGLSFFY